MCSLSYDSSDKNYCYDITKAAVASTTFAQTLANLFCLKDHFLLNTANTACFSPSTAVSSQSSVTLNGVCACLCVLH